MAGVNPVFSPHKVSWRTCDPMPQHKSLFVSKIRVIFPLVVLRSAQTQQARAGALSPPKEEHGLTFHLLEILPLPRLLCHVVRLPPGKRQTFPITPHS